MSSRTPCRSLVFDSGPLLSLSPLRGLAERYYTVPQVLSELKDKKAREHVEQLGLYAAINIEVREPDAASLSQVIQCAKRTGDYSVLSYADLCVLALTHTLDALEKAEAAVAVVESTSTQCVEGPVTTDPTQQPEGDRVAAAVDVDDLALNKLSIENKEETMTTEGMAAGIRHVTPSSTSVEQTEERSTIKTPPTQDSTFDEWLNVNGGDETELQDVHKESSDVATYSSEPIFEDPSDEEDGEGEWITPSNVEYYKSLSLDLFPTSGTSDSFTLVKSKKAKQRKEIRQDARISCKPQERIPVGCITGDFAMQNVLLQMGLNLVGVEGKKIEKVKTWVLRCHACFKICSDSSRKFCHSCGNPTLLRTSVTIKGPGAGDSVPVMQVHLKKNFQYRTRGTIYSIPKSRSGSAKTGSGEGLILREDQTEFVRAMKREQGRLERQEQKILQRSLEASRGGQPAGIQLGSWTEPDWMPGLLSVGTGAKGGHTPGNRIPCGPDGLPIIGYGKRNPNERRRKGR